jgi:hypothetical protein
MSRARPELSDNLLLVAATTILVLTAQRYFETLADLPLLRCRRAP